MEEAVHTYLTRTDGFNLSNLTSLSYCHILPPLSHTPTFLTLFTGPPDRLPTTLAHQHIFRELEHLLSDPTIFPNTRASAILKRDLHTSFRPFRSTGHYQAYTCLNTLADHLLGTRKDTLHPSCQSGLCATSQEPGMVELRTKIKACYEAVEAREKRELERLKRETELRVKQREARIKMRMCYCARTLSLHQPFLNHLQGLELQVHPQSLALPKLERWVLRKLRREFEDYKEILMNAGYYSGSYSDDESETDTGSETDSEPEGKSWVDIAAGMVRDVQMEYSQASLRGGYRSFYRQNQRKTPLWTHEAGEIETDRTDVDIDQPLGRLFGDLLIHLLGTEHEYPNGTKSPCEECSATQSVQSMVELIKDGYRDGRISDDAHFHRPLDSKEEEEVRKMRRLSFKAYFQQILQWGLDSPLKFFEVAASSSCRLDSRSALQKWVQDAGTSIAEALDAIVSMSALESDLVSTVEDVVLCDYEGEDEPVFLKGRCIDILWDLSASPDGYLRDFAEFLFSFGSSKQMSGNFGNYEQARELALRWSSLITVNLELWDLQQRYNQQAEVKS